MDGQLRVSTSSLGFNNFKIKKTSSKNQSPNNIVNWKFDNIGFN
jgi:hypothetical protein